MTLEEEQIEEIRLSLEKINFRLESLDADCKAWIEEWARLREQHKSLSGRLLAQSGHMAEMKKLLDVLESSDTKQALLLVQLARRHGRSPDFDVGKINEMLPSVRVARCPCGAEMLPETAWEDERCEINFQMCKSGHAIDMGAFEPTE